MRKKLIPATILAMVLIFLYLPIILLAVYSFTDSTTIGAIRHFSIENYKVLFTTPQLLELIKGTLLLAFGSAALATILGTLGAIGAFYNKRKVGTAMDLVNQIPVVNSEVVTGFSLCIFLIIVLGIDKDTFLPLIIGHTVLAAPFVYLTVRPRLSQMDPNYYEAALDLGATSLQALKKVILPQLLPSIFSGFMLALTLSLDDYFITIYTKPATFDTISTYVINATKGAQTEIKTALWALSTIIFFIVVAIVAMLNIASKAGQSKEGQA